MEIVNGTGDGDYKAKVNNENQVAVKAVAKSEIAHASHDHGEAYIWTATADWGADVNALWLRNDSRTKKLIIDKIEISLPATCVTEVWKGNGNTVAGTVVTGVNLSCDEIADCTCRHTNTNVDAGSGMTLLASYNHIVVDDIIPFPIDLGKGVLSLGYYDEVAINIVTDVAAVYINIIGHFQ